MTADDLDSPRPRLRTRLALALAAAYALAAAWCVWVATPRVPYADSYRFLVTFDALPFPQDALAADNGHREVLTNLVRIAEFEWFGATQWLQMLVGGVALLAALAVLAAPWLRTAAPRRAAALCLLAVGVLWLGNTRKLAHASELVHLGPIVLCLALGLRALAGGERPSAKSSAAAAVCGLAATLSFGSGLACFAAFGAALAVRRAPLRSWIPLLAGGAAALAALLGGGGGDSAKPVIDPLAQVDLWLRWLGAPFVWGLSPLLDTAHAERLPLGMLGAPIRAVAGAMESACGPHLAARWPGALCGGLGVVAVVRAALLGRRDEPTQVVALGLAAFGATVGALVVALRVAYFAEFPDQVTSQRYLPWSMLFWLGVAWCYCDATSSPRTALRLAIAAALLFAPSQVWTARNAFRLQQTADLTAVGAAVGALDATYPLVETRAFDLVQATPMLRRREAAMFAWPETAVLGTVPDPARLRPIELRSVATAPVANRFDGPASEFWAELPHAAGERLLLLDGIGIAIGIALREPGQTRWRGFLRGTPSADELRGAFVR